MRLIRSILEMAERSGGSTVERQGVADDAEDSRTVWAVWSAWRGDAPLFARIARAALAALGPDARCTIEFDVDGDVERTTTPGGVLDEITPQALRRFRTARIQVADAATTISVVIVRRGNGEERRTGEKKTTRGDSGGGGDPTSGASAGLTTPGVLLTVESPTRPTSELLDIRGAIERAIQRGKFSLRFEPFTSVEPSQGYGGDSNIFLRWRAEARRKVMVGVSVTVAMAAVFVTILIATDGQSILGAYVATGLCALVVATAATLVPANWLPARMARMAARTLAELLLPAVEIAAHTPGRRLGRLGLRVGTLAAGPLVAALVRTLL